MTLFIGKFQSLPPLKRDQDIIGRLLMQGKNVLIALRDTPKDDSNPFTLKERREAFEGIYEPEIKEGKIKIIDIPDEIIWE